MAGRVLFQAFEHVGDSKASRHRRGGNADSLMVISVFAVILQDWRSVTDW